MLKNKTAYHIFLVIIVFLTYEHAYSQDDGERKKTVVSLNVADTLISDSTKIIEDVPLDIAQDRGLFIGTPDGSMQLRILGSVRYLVVFDGRNLNSKYGYSTYEIPTGELNTPLPNYFNGLEQTRLGFEVTRKTDDGDIFIRLETDFLGVNGFRIRHAYGQYKHFLFGQTWSLFSHISASPATVDVAGPTSSLVTRTPQIRFTAPNIYKGFDLALGLEYTIPNLNLPDSSSSETFQLIPSFTTRINKDYDWGSLQLSGVIPVLSGLDSNDKLLLQPGWGISSSVVVNSWKNGKWYIQGVAGKAITRYFTDLSSGGLDLLLAPPTNIYTPLSIGYYGTYEHNWNSNMLSSLTYGWVNLEQFNFTEQNTYHRGQTFRMNSFWDITEGTKIGFETIWGNRINKDKSKGNAFRFNLLFYYDF